MLSLCECLGDAVLGKDDEESAAIAFKHDVARAVALPDIMLQVKFVHLFCKVGLTCVLCLCFFWPEVRTVPIKLYLYHRVYFCPLMYYRPLI